MRKEKETPRRWRRLIQLAEGAVYDAWVGNPDGMPVDDDKCVREVVERHHFTRQCSRKRGHGPGGLFCAVHDKELGRTAVFLERDKLDVALQWLEKLEKKSR